MNLTIQHGPMWQYECPRCGQLSDTYDTEKEMQKGAKTHKCPVDQRDVNWQYLRKLEDLIFHLDNELDLINSPRARQAQKEIRKVMKF